MDEPRAPNPATVKAAPNGQQIYENWNEDVRQAGAQCRTIVKLNCQWYKDRGSDVKC